MYRKIANFRGHRIDSVYFYTRRTFRVCVRVSVADVPFRGQTPVSERNHALDPKATRGSLATHDYASEMAS